MHHIYLSIHNDTAALQQERGELVAWCEENAVNEYSWIEDTLTMGRIPEKCIRALIEPIRQGDTIIVSELSRLGRSLSMFQTVMNHIHENGCTIITLDGRVMEPNRSMTLFVNALNDIVGIEHKMKAFRSIDVLHAMRKGGVVLGRPSGAKKKPEKNVLFGKTERLISLFNKGLSPSKIAAELGVSRGTVANYIRDNIT